MAQLIFDRTVVERRQKAALFPCQGRGIRFPLRAVHILREIGVSSLNGRAAEVHIEHGIGVHLDDDPARAVALGLCLRGGRRQQIFVESLLRIKLIAERVGHVDDLLAARTRFRLRGGHLRRRRACRRHPQTTRQSKRGKGDK